MPFDGNLCNRTLLFYHQFSNSTIADGNFVGVSAQIFHHRFWASKWLFSKTTQRFFFHRLCLIFGYSSNFNFQFLKKFSPENFYSMPLPKTKIYHHFDVFPSPFSSTPPPEQCSANADEDSNSVPKCAKQQSFPFEILFLPNV